MCDVCQHVADDVLRDDGAPSPIDEVQPKYGPPLAVVWIAETVCETPRYMLRTVEV